MELSTELDKKKRILIVQIRGKYRRPHDGFETQHFVINSFPEFGCRRILLDLTNAEIIAGTMPTFQTANPGPDVARELKKSIDAQPGMQAVLTRDGDYYIPLRGRYEKARKARADLFVSIHADAFKQRNVSGSSVFVLSARGASSEYARLLADSENASV